MATIIVVVEVEVEVQFRKVQKGQTRTRPFGNTQNPEPLSSLVLADMRTLVLDQTAAALDATDPKDAMLNHFTVNNPELNAHLQVFTWKHCKRARPLTRSELWKQVSRIIKSAGLGNMKGCGL
jgi:hypothetical protein